MDIFFSGGGGGGGRDWGGGKWYVARPLPNTFKIIEWGGGGQASSVPTPMGNVT